MRADVGNKIKSIILRTEQTRITQLTIQQQKKKKSQFKIMVAVCKLAAHANLVISLHCKQFTKEKRHQISNLVVLKTCRGRKLPVELTLVLHD